jgi:hypothetical protein
VPQPVLPSLADVRRVVHECYCLVAEFSRAGLQLMGGLLIARETAIVVFGHAAALAGSITGGLLAAVGRSWHMRR